MPVLAERPKESATQFVRGGSIDRQRFEPDISSRRTLAPDVFPHTIPVYPRMPKMQENGTEIIPGVADNIAIINRAVIGAQSIRSALDSGLKKIGIVLWEGDRDSFTARYAETLTKETGGKVEVIYIGGDTIIDAYKKRAEIIKKLKEKGYTRANFGWGLDAENADAIQEYEEGGIISIGPKSEQVRAWGHKANALRMAEAAGVPVLPWIDGAGLTTWEEVKDAITKKGLKGPFMLKADLSGSGRGNKPAYTMEQLKDVWVENHSIFENNGGYHITEMHPNARHIELQIIGDKSGNIVVLGQRNCSIQRRHQKLVEESQAVNPMLAALTKSMLQKQKYEGPGTVEFLFDPATGKYYFMEMNTRLQVEVPVTEGITGVDVIGTVDAAANGYELNPDAIEQRPGQVIEVRLVARTGGKIKYIDFSVNDKADDDIPANVRIDTACGNGSTIHNGVSNGTVDGLQAQIIAAGYTREDTIEGLIKVIEGIQKTYKGTAKLNFDELLFILRDPEYAAGTITIQQAEEKFAMRERMERIANGELSNLLFRHGEDTRPELSLNMTYADFIHYLANPDSEMKEEGKRQVIASLESMGIEDIAALGAIMTSPARRAVQTAEIIRDRVKGMTGKEIEIIQNEDLREVPLSGDIITEEEYQQLLNAAEGDPSVVINEVYRRWETNHPQLRESHEASFARANRALKSLETKAHIKPDQVYAVVSHGFFGRVLEYAKAGYTLDKINHLSPKTLAQIPPLNHGRFISMQEPVTEHPIYQYQPPRISSWTGRLQPGTQPPFDHNEGKNPRGAGWSGRR